MLVRAFITHKESETFSDCQDRFCINQDTESVAVSDGMSSSVFQKIWAEILVRSYTKNKVWNFDKVSKKLRAEWMAQVEKYVTDSERRGMDMRRAKNSLAMKYSAGATLVGLRFTENYHWVCDVLGDSCLVIIEKEKISKIISSQKTDEFNNYPDYLDSGDKPGKGQFKKFEGDLKEGQYLLLVSDPFSDFLSRMKGTEEEQGLVRSILHLKSLESFYFLVNDWRNKGMHNDDSTLLIIEYDNDLRLNVQHLDEMQLYGVAPQQNTYALSEDGSQKKKSEQQTSVNDLIELLRDKKLKAIVSRNFTDYILKLDEQRKTCFRNMLKYLRRKKYMTMRGNVVQSVESVWDNIVHDFEKITGRKK